MRRLLAVLLLLADLLSAGETKGLVPNSATVVSSTTVRLYQLNCSNNTGGSATLIILDRSTNCAGSGCPVWPTVSLAANSKYTANMSGEPAEGGFTWQASAASTLYCWISFTNSPAP